ncbi:uncharacterized protein LOC108090360 [Drosophila ficusphila]|uniref:uncharacterized protein LOC108090360 n=1 Tax=Drosophila ficusphila TaxID=30025 RepID=UPI0007E707F0|nr:uncharacterized protein LOC108090360 [Drosophila ficusphila]
MQKVEESPIFRRRHILGEVRSVSVDRYRYTQNEEGGFTQYAPKVQEYQHRVASPLVTRPVHQHPLRPSSGDIRFEPRMNRRSSVPISINYQTVYISSPSYPPELARRGSVISLTGQTLDASAMPSGAVDPKRRVRMINRH